MCFMSHLIYPFEQTQFLPQITSQIMSHNAIMTQQTLWVEGHGMFDSKYFILSSCKSFESHHFPHYSQNTIKPSA